MPAAGGWVCEYDVFPAVKWFSPTDVSEPAVGLTCTRVDHPPGGTGPKAWYELWKLAQLIEAWPW